MITAETIVRLGLTEGKTVSDRLAVEEPLETRVEGRSVAVTMRTPGHDRELAAGFLLSEGVIRSRADVFDISQCPSDTDGNTLDVLLKDPGTLDMERLTRHVFTSSSCGICGKAAIERIAQHFPPVTSPVRVPRKAVFALPEALAQAQPAFRETGALHAAAIFDETGRLTMLREDVGRHNAIDKILGLALFSDVLPLSRHILLVSGRTSFEILQKALAGGIPIVAAIGAPSSLAVEVARANGQTLIGFLRSERMNIYSCPERIE